MDFRNPSRREILAGLGATAFTPFASKFAIAQSFPTNPDVAIVGSGPAGLSAARTPVSYTHLTLPTNREV